MLKPLQTPPETVCGHATTAGLQDTSRLTACTSNVHKIHTTKSLQAQHLHHLLQMDLVTSAKDISVRAEWLRQSGRALSEPSETLQWRITPPRVSIPHVVSPSDRRFFSLCRSPILNKSSAVVANCDHTSGWVHWVHACIEIATHSETLQNSLLTFLLHHSREA
jgi:hypothetical protein